MGTFRASPIIDILSETMKVPLKTRRMNLSIKFAAKISSTFQNSVFINTFRQNAAPTIHSVKKTALTFYNRISQYEHDLNTKVILATPRNKPSFPPWTLPIISTNTDLRKHNKKHSNPNILKSLFWELCERYQDRTHIYTDVSKTKNGTGYSIVFEHSTTKVKFLQDTSILTGELNAIKHALEATSNYHNRKFATSSDSTNAITSILN